jgi:hemerythrin-like domain-containing protein
MVYQHILLQTLSKDHEDELTFAKRLIYGRPDDIQSNWPSNEDILQQVVRAKEIFFNELLYHFIIEEEVLFDEMRPLFKDAGGKHIVDLLLEQHIALKKLFGELDAIIFSKEVLKKKLHNIGAILKNHIYIEENQLFPLLEKEISTIFLDKFWENLKNRPKLDAKNLL